MNCEMVREQLGAWCDRQLEPDQATAIDGHLATCPECRFEGESLRDQDRHLRRVLQPHRLAAERVASRVVERLQWDPEIAASQVVPLTSARWGSLLLAAAAGFLLAVLVFQPWKRGPQVAQNIQFGPEVGLHAAPAAQLVVATGAVEIRQPGEQNWEPSSGSSSFGCPAGSAVRTGPHVQCELKTSSGGVIRLNDDTQIKFAAGDTIEVECGQIWCSSPDGMVMNVLAPADTSSRVPSESAWAVTCQAEACVQTDAGRNGGTQVTTSAGNVDVQTPRAHRKLKSGDSVSIVQGAIVNNERAADPLLSTRWTQPLLVRKGYDNPELNVYVDRLLTRVSQSQPGMLYEQDIRSLGEYGALPLIRYVQSPLSQNDLAKRQSAMRIGSDIAPSWAIGELIKLLADADSETRFFAARTLQRLTGLDQGRSPDQWRDDFVQCQPTIDLWLQWWARNQNFYPPPTPSASPV